MINVDTRSANTHRVWKYISNTIITLIMLASFVVAYFVVTYGI